MRIRFPVPNGDRIQLTVYKGVLHVGISSEAYDIGDLESGWTFVPAAPVTTGPYFFGCYDDYRVSASDTANPLANPDDWDLQSWSKIGRDFPYAKIFHTENSVAICAAAAKAQGSAAFGMSKSSECW